MKVYNQIIYIITSLSAHGAQKNLCRFIEKSTKYDIKNICVYTLKDFDRSSYIYKKISSNGVNIVKLDGFEFFRLLSKKILKKQFCKNESIVLFAWMYHSMFVSFFLKYFIYHNSKLLWTLRHGEPFHEGIQFKTRIIIFFDLLIHRIFNVPALVNSRKGLISHTSIGFKKNLLYLWPNFLPDHRLKPLINNFSTDKEIKLLYPARYHAQKNHIMALEVLKILLYDFDISAKLILVGDGIDTLFSNLTKSKQFHSILEYVSFLPSTSNIRQYYYDSDIVISTSSFGEGLQNIIIEALIYGKLVFSTSAGDASEILTSKFIVKTNQSYDMASSIANCLFSMRELSDHENPYMHDYSEQYKKLIQFCDVSDLFSIFNKALK
ncbi:glycosyltransferase [Prochlorococcus marinus]|uniref:glycosyltransferase n=1 Tax=Prochlorococcus marinus TaxID=1219 RepID=UPI0039B03CF0